MNFLIKSDVYIGIFSIVLFILLFIFITLDVEVLIVTGEKFVSPSVEVSVSSIWEVLESVMKLSQSSELFKCQFL